MRGQNGKQSLSRAVRLGLSEKQSFELRSERIVSVSVRTVVGGVPGRWSALRGERREVSGEAGQGRVGRAFGPPYRLCF